MNIEIRQSPSVTPPPDLSSTGRGASQDAMSLFDAILRAPSRAIERPPAEPTRPVDASPRDDSPKPRDPSNDPASQRPVASNSQPKDDPSSPSAADQREQQNDHPQAAKATDQPADKRGKAPAGKSDTPANADAASTDEASTKVVPIVDEAAADETAEPAADGEAAATPTDAAQQLAAALAVKADKGQQPHTDPAADPDGNAATKAATEMALDGAGDAASPTTATNTAANQATVDLPQPGGPPAAVADGAKANVALAAATQSDANQASAEQAANGQLPVDTPADADGKENGDVQGNGIPQPAVAANVAAPVLTKPGDSPTTKGKDPKSIDEPAVDGQGLANGEATTPEVATGVQEPTATQAAKEKKQNEKSKDGEHVLDATKPAETNPLPEPVVSELPPAEPPPVDPGASNTATIPAHEASHTHQQPLITDAPARSASPARLAASLLAPAHRDGRDSQPVEVDSARFLHRVARAFTAAQQRGGEVQLRLSPPELGALRIEVKVHDGVLTARVETDNAVARAAVVEHLPQLRDRLAEQGVRIERFDVDLMQQSSTGTPDGSHDRQPSSPTPHRPRTIPAAAAASAASDAPRSPLPAVGSGGLNVVI